MADEEMFRTTLSITMELLEKIDDLHHEAMKRGEISRNMNRNPYIARLLEERVNELVAERKAGSAKKRSTA